MKNLIFILIVMLVGCELDSTTNDQEFNVEYLQPFLAQADGYNIHRIKSPVTIEYVDGLVVNGMELAGFTDYATKTITFDTSHELWNSDARIVIIYHELAHFYLNKGHIDESVSCDVPFSIMSLWSKEHAPIQFEYWVSGTWREHEDYYMEELFKGSHVWYKYLDHQDVLSHYPPSPCWD